MQTLLDNAEKVLSSAALTSKVKLLGIRGYKGENLLGEYDDLIIVYNQGKLTNFVASTDPGKYYIQNPVNAQGCAQLVPGLWHYKVGFHQGKHLALVQASEVQIARLNKASQVECYSRGFYGINIHSGGASEDVGHWSAGCQIIHSPEGAWGKTWQDFLELVREAGSNVIPYFLLERHQLLNYTAYPLSPLQPLPLGNS